ncbi:hypothetical protein NFI96_032270 [Prochilodus magdalenae]|nr:hypothetical protein NFI96_032270 [Prochilodus magdalenae]
MKVTTIPECRKSAKVQVPSSGFYVSTYENPADTRSRGTSIDELLSSNCFTGPQFLWEMEIETPVEVIQELPSWRSRSKTGPKHCKTKTTEKH